LERRPVHWPLVFPEVFSLRGGFHAIVGNPPFLGGKKLTGAFGDAYRECMVEHLARGRRGNADLVAYFELRAHEFLNEFGQTGLIATNSLAQGDSREVSLDQIESSGVTIRRAVKSAPWPSSSVQLEYCAIWTSRGAVSPSAPMVLGGYGVSRGITTSLNPQSRQESWAEPLKGNLGNSFVGSYVLGLGFTLGEVEAHGWIAEDQRYADVLFPYLNGQDVSNHPEHATRRWVINFHDWSESEAAEYPLAFKKIVRDVKPERQKRGARGEFVLRKPLPQRYWQYADKRPAMVRALSTLDWCIVITRVSKVVMPVMVKTGQVFSEQLVVFASDDPALFAFLSSSLHYWWAIECASTLETRIRYTPTDVFDTLLTPPLTDRLREAGIRLDAYRRELMLDRNAGLTDIYNLVHSSEGADAAIVELRNLHEEIDRAAIEAYGWHDLLDDTEQTPPADSTHETFPLDHGFHETDQGIRYTVGLFARTEIIDRLRQLNHQAYADEVHLGLHKVTEKQARQKRPDLPPPSLEVVRKRKEQLTARQGSDFGEGVEGALF
jgi:hypothetical protein